MSFFILFAKLFDSRGCADLAFHRRRGLSSFTKETTLMSDNKNLKEQRKKIRRKPKYSSVSYTTGDIGLNIDHFNQRMGTANVGANSTEGTTNEGGLCESKRYVRRYYIRPQNIFCSNKAEIIKALIELDDANCSVYTLNNLGDEKDVSKLMNSDIIYYYDNGILYDKNKVKVMDYDLSIKKEENRKHFANVDKASEKEFKNEYKDRMTDATELEEMISLDEAFNLDFDDFNVFGERLTEAKEAAYCCFCGEPIDGPGKDPKGVMGNTDGKCCDGCNLKFVTPTFTEGAN
jgi:hypothetical protein